MRHKEDARLVEGERKHLLRIREKRVFSLKERICCLYFVCVFIPWKTFCHRKLILNKGHMS